MVDPFGPVRAAVEAWGTTPSSRPINAPTAAPGPTPVFSPNAPAVAVWDALLGKLVAVYQPEAYPRWLDALATTCDEIVPVHLYQGAITPSARFTSHGDGSLADYSPPIPRFIPPGAGLFVVWDATDSTSTATANAQLREAR